MAKKKISAGDIVQLVLLFLPVLAIVGVLIYLGCDGEISEEQSARLARFLEWQWIVSWTLSALWDCRAIYLSERRGGKWIACVGVVLLVGLAVGDLLFYQRYYEASLVENAARRAWQSAWEAEAENTNALCDELLSQMELQRNAKLAVGLLRTGFGVTIPCLMRVSKNKKEEEN